MVIQGVSFVGYFLLSANQVISFYLAFGSTYFLVPGGFHPMCLCGPFHIFTKDLQILRGTF